MKEYLKLVIDVWEDMSLWIVMCATLLSITGVYLGLYSAGMANLLAYLSFVLFYTLTITLLRYLRNERGL